jgi:hypothetical protein
VERKQNQQNPGENEQQTGVSVASSPEEPVEPGIEAEAVAPGVEVVRSNTPRPLSVDSLITASGYWRAIQAGEPTLTFPAQAPAAPPVPEELGEDEGEKGLSPTTPTPVAPSSSAVVEEETREFSWLFEYGLEMDPIYLNSVERLDGLALFSGPAMLKGYTLMVGAQHQQGTNGEGQAVFAILPAPEPDGEVWGVLYRIPRHLAEKRGEGPSLLDTVHCAAPPKHLFQGMQVMVRDMKHDQEISCLTYMATEMACRQLRLVAVEQWDGEPLLVQQLADIAQRQKLPDSYVHYLVGKSFDHSLSAALMPEVRPQSRQAMSIPQIPPSTLPPSTNLPMLGFFLRGESGLGQPGSSVSDPLSSFKEEPDPPFQAPEKGRGDEPAPAPIRAKDPQQVSHQPPTPRRLIIFALYLVFLQLSVLAFAILQGLGMGQEQLSSSFTPLGVPWLVMIYGLLGGCLSSIATLARLRNTNLPLFVVITWFARPFVGAILALFTFMLLTSGLFTFGSYFEQHLAFFWLAGGVAGLSESWFFFKRR